MIHNAKHHHQYRGIIQLLPMVILAVVALTSFVIMTRVEQDAQDIRSQAATSSSCVNAASYYSNMATCASVTCSGYKTQSECGRKPLCCEWKTVSVTATKKPNPTATKVPTKTPTPKPTCTNVGGLPSASAPCCSGLVPGSGGLCFVKPTAAIAKTGLPILTPTPKPTTIWQQIVGSLVGLGIGKGLGIGPITSVTESVPSSEIPSKEMKPEVQPVNPVNGYRMRNPGEPCSTDPITDMPCENCPFGVVGTFSSGYFCQTDGQVESLPVAPVTETSSLPTTLDDGTQCSLGFLGIGNTCKRCLGGQSHIEGTGSSRIRVCGPTPKPSELTCAQIGEFPSLTSPCCAGLVIGSGGLCFAKPTASTTLCVPDSKTCVGAVLKTCTADGTGYLLTTCDSWCDIDTLRCTSTVVPIPPQEDEVARFCGSFSNGIRYGCRSGWSCGVDKEGEWTVNRVNCSELGGTCEQGNCVYPDKTAGSQQFASSFYEIVNNTCVRKEQGTYAKELDCKAALTVIAKEPTSQPVVTLKTKDDLVSCTTCSAIQEKEKQGACFANCITPSTPSVTPPVTPATPTPFQFKTKEDIAEVQQQYLGVAGKTVACGTSGTITLGQNSTIYGCGDDGLWKNLTARGIGPDYVTIPNRDTLVGGNAFFTAQQQAIEVIETEKMAAINKELGLPTVASPTRVKCSSELGTYYTGAVVVGSSTGGAITKWECGTDGRWSSCTNCLITTIPAHLQTKEGYLSTIPQGETALRAAFTTAYDACLKLTPSQTASCVTQAVNATNQKKIEDIASSYATALEECKNNKSMTCEKATTLLASSGLTSLDRYVVLQQVAVKQLQAKQEAASTAFSDAIGGYFGAVDNQEEQGRYQRAAEDACVALGKTRQECVKLVITTIDNQEQLTTALVAYLSADPQDANWASLRKTYDAMCTKIGVTNDDCALNLSNAYQQRQQQLSALNQSALGIVFGDEGLKRQNCSKAMYGLKRPCTTEEVAQYLESLVNIMPPEDRAQFDQAVKEANEQALKEQLARVSQSQVFSDYKKTHPDATVEAFVELQTTEFKRFSEDLTYLGIIGDQESESYKQYVSDMQEGKIDVAAQRKAYLDATKFFKHPVAATVNAFNYITHGVTKKGNELMLSQYEDCTGNTLLSCKTKDTYNAWTVARGALMQGAAPAMAGVVIVGLPLTVPFATTVGMFGMLTTTAGIAGTAFTTAQIGEFCDGSVTNRANCGNAVGNFVFSAVSTGVGVAAQVVRAGQVVNLARTAGNVAVKSADAIVDTVKLSRVAELTGVAAKVVTAEKAVSGVGTAWFGYQALQSCGVIDTGAPASGLGCGMSIAMTGVSAFRFITAIIPAKTPPPATVGRAINQADAVQNTAQGIVTCVSAAQGGATWGDCAQAVGGAALSFGGTTAPKSDADGIVTTRRSLEDAKTAVSDLYEPQTSRLHQPKLKQGVTIAQVNEAKANLQTAIIARGNELATIEIAQSVKVKIPQGGKPTSVQALLLQSQEQMRLIQEARKSNASTIRFADGREIALTPDVEQAAITTLLASQQAYQQEQYALTSDPRRFVQKTRDTVSRFFGREPQEVSELRLAQQDLQIIAQTQDPTTSAYQKAIRRIELAQEALLIKHGSAAELAVIQQRKFATLLNGPEEARRLESDAVRLEKVYQDLEADPGLVAIRAKAGFLRTAEEVRQLQNVDNAKVAAETARAKVAAAETSITPPSSDPDGLVKKITSGGLTDAEKATIKTQATDAEAALQKLWGEYDAATPVAKDAMRADLAAAQSTADYYRVLSDAITIQERLVIVQQQEARSLSGRIKTLVASTRESVSLRQRLLGTNEKPTGLGRIAQSVKISPERPPKVLYAEMHKLMVQQPENALQVVKVEDGGKGKYRIAVPDGASRALKQEIERLNAAVERLEIVSGYSLRERQETLLVTSKAILQLEAGGGKTTVIGPMLAAIERTTVFALPTETNMKDFVNDVYGKKAFFDEEQIEVFVFDNERGFLRIGKDFTLEAATKVDVAEVRRIADRAKTHPEEQGIMIITQSSDNAWAMIGGKRGDSPESVLMYDCVLGSRDFTLVYDEIGAVVNGSFSVSKGAPDKIQALTDPKQLHGYSSGQELLVASKTVYDMESLGTLRAAVLKRLNDKQSVSDLFMEVTVDGIVIRQPRPNDERLIGRSYEELLGKTLDQGPAPTDAVGKQMTKIREALQKNPGDLQAQRAFEQLLKTPATTPSDRLALNDLAYRSADLQARWSILSKTPDIHFGLEQGEVVIRQAGGTTGETYSAVTQRIALQEEGLAMLGAIGKDTSGAIQIADLTVTPDSDQITNVEIMRIKAARGTLKGYDATPDSASSALGVEATQRSELPPSGIKILTSFARDSDVFTLIKKGVEVDQARTQGKTLAFVLADDHLSYQAVTDELVQTHPDVEVLFRTKFRTDLQGEQQTEYYKETIIRNGDRITRTEETRFPTQEAWDSAIHSELRSGKGNTGKVMLVYEGRTRAVDFSVTDENKNIRWTVIAGDQNTAEDITQAYKRNRVPAKIADLKGWSKDDIDAASTYSLWVRSGDTTITTGKKAINRYTKILTQKLATDRFEATVRSLSGSTEQALIKARDILLVGKSQKDQTAIRQQFDTLLSDAKRIERAQIMEFQNTPLIKDNIPMEIYRRGKLAYDQLTAQVESLKTMYKLSPAKVRQLKTSLGIDKPYISEAEFVKTFEGSVKKLPSSLSPNGPLERVSAWAETTAKADLPSAVFQKPTTEDASIVAKPISVPQVEDRVAQQRFDQAARVVEIQKTQAQDVPVSVRQSQRNTLLGAFMTAQQLILVLQTALENLKTPQDVVLHGHTIEATDVIEGMSLQDGARIVVFKPGNQTEGTLLGMETPVDMFAYDYVIVPNTYTGDITNRTDLEAHGGRAIAEHATVKRTTQTDTGLEQQEDALLEKKQEIEVFVQALERSRLEDVVFRVAALVPTSDTQMQLALLLMAEEQQLITAVQAIDPSLPTRDQIVSDSIAASQQRLVTALSPLLPTELSDDEKKQIVEALFAPTATSIQASLRLSQDSLGSRMSDVFRSLRDGIVTWFTRTFQQQPVSTKETQRVSGIGTVTAWLQTSAKGLVTSVGAWMTNAIASRQSSGPRLDISGFFRTMTRQPVVTAVSRVFDTISTNRSTLLLRALNSTPRQDTLLFIGTRLTLFVPFVQNVFSPLGVYDVVRLVQWFRHGMPAVDKGIPDVAPVQTQQETPVTGIEQATAPKQEQQEAPIPVEEQKIPSGQEEQPEAVQKSPVQEAAPVVLQQPAALPVIEQEGVPRALTAAEVAELHSLVGNPSQPKLTREFLAQTTFFPKEAMTINGRTFYLSSVFQIMENGKKGYEEAIMYTKLDDGRIVPRVLYKSNSDGGWRSTPSSFQGKFSKGLGVAYTQETKPHEALNRYFNATTHRTTYNEDIIDTKFNIKQLEQDKIYTYESEQKIYDDGGALAQPQGFPPGTYGDKEAERGHDDYIKYKGKFSEEFENFQYPKGFVPDFTKNPEKVETSQHTLLGPVTFETYPGVLNGRSIKWVMAYDKAGRTWIERIYFSDAVITSYGVYDEIINSGALTNKPLEYKSQISELQANADYVLFDGHYVDITPLLAHLVPIQEFKKARTAKSQEVPALVEEVIPEKPKTAPVDVIPAVTMNQLRQESTQTKVLPKGAYLNSLSRVLEVLKPIDPTTGQRKVLSGITLLPTDVPTIVVSDLHARRDFLIEVLDQRVGGVTVFELLKQGKLNLVLLGDGMHTEKADAWPREYEDEQAWLTTTGEKEMAASLGIMRMIMELKATFPEHFHYLRGNHDEINGNFMKYAQGSGESSLVRQWMKLHGYDDVLTAWATFEDSLPLVAIGGPKGKQFVLSHTAPAEEVTKEALEQRDPDAVNQVTWSDNTRQDQGSLQAAVDGTLHALGLDAGTHWIIGHRQVDFGYTPDGKQRIITPVVVRSQLGGRLLQINSSHKHLVLVVPTSGIISEKSAHDISLGLSRDCFASLTSPIGIVYAQEGIGEPEGGCPIGLMSPIRFLRELIHAIRTRQPVRPLITTFLATYPSTVTTIIKTMISRTPQQGSIEETQQDETEQLSASKDVSVITSSSETTEEKVKRLRVEIFSSSLSGVELQNALEFIELYGDVDLKVDIAKNLAVLLRDRKISVEIVGEILEFILKYDNGDIALALADCFGIHYSGELVIPIRDKNNPNDPDYRREVLRYIIKNGDDRAAAVLISNFALNKLPIVDIEDIHQVWNFIIQHDTHQVVIELASALSAGGFSDSPIRLQIWDFIGQHASDEVASKLVPIIVPPRVSLSIVSTSVSDQWFSEDDVNKSWAIIEAHGDLLSAEQLASYLSVGYFSNPVTLRRVWDVIEKHGNSRVSHYVQKIISNPDTLSASAIGTDLLTKLQAFVIKYANGRDQETHPFDFGADSPLFTNFIAVLRTTSDADRSPYMRDSVWLYELIQNPITARSVLLHVLNLGVNPSSIIPLVELLQSYEVAPALIDAVIQIACEDTAVLQSLLDNQEQIRQLRETYGQLNAFALIDYLFSKGFKKEYIIALIGSVYPEFVEILTNPNKLQQVDEDILSSFQDMIRVKSALLTGDELNAEIASYMMNIIDVVNNPNASPIDLMMLILHEKYSDDPSFNTKVKQLTDAGIDDTVARETIIAQDLELLLIQSGSSTYLTYLQRQLQKATSLQERQSIQEKIDAIHQNVTDADARNRGWVTGLYRADGTLKSDEERAQLIVPDVSVSQVGPNNATLSIIQKGTLPDAVRLEWREHDMLSSHVTLTAKQQGRLVITRLASTHDSANPNGSQVERVYDLSSWIYQPIFSGIQGPNHYIVHGGLPSTYITAIVVRDIRFTRSQKQQVARGGWYIPIFDLQGQLLFTPEEFDEMRAIYYPLEQQGYPEAVMDAAYRTYSELKEKTDRTDKDDRQWSALSQAVRQLKTELEDGREPTIDLVVLISRLDVDSTPILLESLAQKPVQALADTMEEAGDRAEDHCGGGQTLRILPQVYAQSGPVCSFADQVINSFKRLGIWTKMTQMVRSSWRTLWGDLYRRTMAGRASKDTVSMINEEQIYTLKTAVLTEHADVLQRVDVTSEAAPETVQKIVEDTYERLHPGLSPPEGLIASVVSRILASKDTSAITTPSEQTITPIGSLVRSVRTSLNQVWNLFHTRTATMLSSDLIRGRIFGVKWPLALKVRAWKYVEQHSTKQIAENLSFAMTNGHMVIDDFGPAMEVIKRYPSTQIAIDLAATTLFGGFPDEFRLTTLDIIDQYGDEHAIERLAKAVSLGFFSGEDLDKAIHIIEQHPSEAAARHLAGFLYKYYLPDHIFTRVWEFIKTYGGAGAATELAHMISIVYSHRGVSPEVITFILTHGDRVTATALTPFLMGRDIDPDIRPEVWNFIKDNGDKDTAIYLSTLLHSDNFPESIILEAVTFIEQYADSAIADSLVRSLKRLTGAGLTHALPIIAAKGSEELIFGLTTDIKKQIVAIRSLEEQPPGIFTLLSYLPEDQWKPTISRRTYLLPVLAPVLAQSVTEEISVDRLNELKGQIRDEVKKRNDAFITFQMKLAQGYQPQTEEEFVMLDVFLSSIDDEYEKRMFGTNDPTFVELAKTFAVPHWETLPRWQVLQIVSQQLHTIPLRAMTLSFPFTMQEARFSIPDTLLPQLQTFLSQFAHDTSPLSEEQKKYVETVGMLLSDATIDQLLDETTKEQTFILLQPYLRPVGQDVLIRKIRGIIASSLSLEQKRINVKNVLYGSLDIDERILNGVWRELFTIADIEGLIPGFIAGTLHPSEMNLFVQRLGELISQQIPEYFLDHPTLAYLQKTLESTDGFKLIKQANVRIIETVQQQTKYTKQISLVFTPRTLLDVWQGAISGTCFGDHPAHLAKRENIIPVKLVKDGEVFGNALFLIQPSVKPGEKDKFILIGFDPSISFTTAITSDKMHEFIDRSMEAFVQIADENGWEFMIGLPDNKDMAKMYKWAYDEDRPETGGLSNRPVARAYIEETYLPRATQIDIVPEQKLHPRHGYEPRHALRLAPAILAALRAPTTPILLESLAQKPVQALADTMEEAGDRAEDHCGGGQTLRILPQVYAQSGPVCSFADQVINSFKRLGIWTKMTQMVRSSWRTLWGDLYRRTMAGRASKDTVSMINEEQIHNLETAVLTEHADVLQRVDIRSEAAPETVQKIVEDTYERLHPGLSPPEGLIASVVSRILASKDPSMITTPSQPPSLITRLFDAVRNRLSRLFTRSTPPTQGVTQEEFASTVESVVEEYKPDGCSTCSLVIRSIVDLLTQAQTSETGGEQFGFLTQAVSLLDDHAMTNEVAYASGRVLTEAQIFSLFGVNREELIASLTTALAIVKDIQEDELSVGTVSKLQSLQRVLSALLMRFAPDATDLLDDDPSQLSFHQFVYYITGIWPTPGTEYALAARMEEDHFIVKQKYGLPPRSLKMDNPREYIVQLEQLAQQHGIVIRPGLEFQAFFDTHKHVDAVYMEEEGIVVVPRVDTTDPGALRIYASSLEHELIHALQDKYYPSLPIEGMEYEAYVAANIGVGEITSTPLSAIDRLFGFYISGSVNFWYKEEQIEERPWHSLVKPPEKSSAPGSVQLTEEESTVRQTQSDPQAQLGPFVVDGGKNVSIIDILRNRLILIASWMDRTRFIDRMIGRIRSAWDIRSIKQAGVYTSLPSGTHIEQHGRFYRVDRPGDGIKLTPVLPLLEAHIPAPPIGTFPFTTRLGSSRLPVRYDDTGFWYNDGVRERKITEEGIVFDDGRVLFLTKDNGVSLVWYTNTLYQWRSSFTIVYVDGVVQITTDGAFGKPFMPYLVNGVLQYTTRAFLQNKDIITVPTGDMMVLHEEQGSVWFTNYFSDITLTERERTMLDGHLQALNTPGFVAYAEQYAAQHGVTLSTFWKKSNQDVYNDRLFDSHALYEDYTTLGGASVDIQMRVEALWIRRALVQYLLDTDPSGAALYRKYLYSQPLFLDASPLTLIHRYAFGLQKILHEPESEWTPYERQYFETTKQLKEMWERIVENDPDVMQYLHALADALDPRVRETFDRIFALMKQGTVPQTDELRSYLYRPSTTTGTLLKERIIGFLPGAEPVMWGYMLELAYGRSLVPEAAITKHHASIQSFWEQYFQSEGMVMPEGFYPLFTGEELSFYTRAHTYENNSGNAGGFYFLDMMTTEEKLVHTFNHEASHLMVKPTGGWVRPPGGEPFVFEEIMTELLAQMETSGSLTSYPPADNKIFEGCIYYEGVRELISIMEELDAAAGQPMYGFRLLVDGIIAYNAGGVSAPFSPLQYVVAAYSSYTQKTDWEDRLAPYQDPMYRIRTPLGSVTEPPQVVQ